MQAITIDEVATILMPGGTAGYDYYPFISYETSNAELTAIAGKIAPVIEKYGAKRDTEYPWSFEGCIQNDDEDKIKEELLSIGIQLKKIRWSGF